MRGLAIAMRRGAWCVAAMWVLAAAGCHDANGPQSHGRARAAGAQKFHWQPGAAAPSWVCAKALTGSHATFDVGPGKKYGELSEVPWLTLQAGDVVNIHWRPQPYRTKIALRAQGTAGRPVVLNGVTNEHCQRPEISGQNALIAQDAVAENYYASPVWAALGVIFIYKRHDDAADYKPRHIRIQNLRITGGTSREQFIGPGGTPTPYARGAAGVYASVVEHLTVDNCEITGNDNGIFVNTREDTENLTSRHITVRHSAIHLNGVADSYTEHNLYLQAASVLVEGSYIGQLIPSAKGSSLKDRSSGTVIRYNHIVAAARALDLVETEGGAPTVAKDPNYHDAWVYGNLIVSDMNLPGASSVKLIHWGGDNQPALFRHGTLYFYANTVVTRGDKRQAAYFSVFDMPTAEQKVDARDNIFWRDGSAALLLGYEAGNVVLQGRNWISRGWKAGKNGQPVSVQAVGTLLEGDDPGLDADYQPQAQAGVSDQGGSSLADVPAPSGFSDVLVQYQYVPIGGTRGRPMIGAGPDLGAFEGF